MRPAWRYAAVTALLYVVVMTALVISRYGPWGLPERFLPIELQQVLVWPFHWITEPLLATDRVVPIWSISGRANEAATWRELVVYNSVGAVFYALLTVVTVRMRRAITLKRTGVG